ncbi:TlyA family RNA methyltransferase [Marinimicrobium sp. ARAG 43.8]|uniref:TlyA family RNA methyltransferase n=1 Tax=Marinimicrobium sp. ARAG 43.8 TaxID=3418719 RepID=UPI003CE94385
MSAAELERLDKLLVARGLADTRTRAQRLIEAGRVRVQLAGRWQVQHKPGVKLPMDVALEVEPAAEDEFVSRGGIKLRGALEGAALDVAGWTALDIGQSTGGFTDCLLRQGAARVVGVDVGRDQLAPALRKHPKVVCHEGINARQLPTDRLLAEAPDGFDLAVMDVSFISQTLILPGIAPLLRSGGWLVSLVKPQFEVGRDGIGKGGIVRDARLYKEVEAQICHCCRESGLEVNAYFGSPITGGDGNREFFVVARKTGEPAAKA